MGKMNALDWLVMVLVIVGALNWGLVGIFDFNLVAYLLSFSVTLIKVVYIVVGVAGLYMIYTASKAGK